MKYRWEEHADSTITVYDMEIMGTLRAGVRGPKAIDIKWLRNSVDVYKRWQALGRNMLLLLGHNDFKNNRQAPVIGKLYDPFVDEPRGLLIAKRTHVTDPNAVNKFKRGEFPTRSSEFIPDAGLVWGLSMLEGFPGHFDSQWNETTFPEIILEETPSNLAPELALLFNSDRVMVCSATMNQTAELEMALTKEDLEAIKGVVKDTVTTEVKSQIEQLGLKPSNDPESDLNVAAADLVKKERQEIAVLKRDTQLDGYVAQLSSHTKLNAATVRKMFDGVPNEALKYKFEQLMSKYAKDVQLDADESGVETVETQLRKEFEQLGGKDRFHMTAEDYVGHVAGLADDLKV
jgi:hypothetical protein